MSIMKNRQKKNIYNGQEGKKISEKAERESTEKKGKL